MIIDFQQGIVSYPSSGSLQVFLSRSGQYVNLSVVNGRVDVTFAHGNENYFHTEAEDVPNAWGPLDPGIDYWLYWDIDLRTAQRTFGFTTTQPVVSATMPSGVDGLHWFNTSTKKMSVYGNGRFRECLRVFAARVNNATFIPLGVQLGKPFAGSQVGLNIPDVFAGRILIDTNGKPVKRADGSFFTSESKFFFNGTPINSMRLEGGITHATASQNIARFQVVAMSDFEQIRVATYEDLQSASIALCMTNALTGEVAELCVQGMVTNPDWNWLEVGRPLWVNDNGDLTATDPHIANPILHATGKPPIARVFSKTSIYFDQGLGGKGDAGTSVVTDVVPATTTTLGTVRLTVPAIDATQPVVVTTNDPRMTNARTPTAHTHPASAVTTRSVGVLTGSTLDEQLEQIEAKLPTPTKSVVWNQGSASATWNIVHNQNSVYPIVTPFKRVSGTYQTMDPLSYQINIIDANQIDLVINGGDTINGRAHILFIEPTSVLGLPGDDTAPVILTNMDASFVNLCNPMFGDIIGRLEASDNTEVTKYKFVDSSYNISTDDFFTIDYTGNIILNAMGHINMPISNTYQVQAGDANDNWSNPVTIHITCVGASTSFDTYNWIVPILFAQTGVVPTASTFGGIDVIADRSEAAVINDDGSLRWQDRFISPTWTNGYLMYNAERLCNDVITIHESLGPTNGAVTVMRLAGTSGDIVWQKAIGAGTNQFEKTRKVVVSNHSIYATAFRMYGTTYHKAGLLKFNNDGSLVVQQLFGLTGPVGEHNNSKVFIGDIVVDSTGDYLYLSLGHDTGNGIANSVMKVDGNTLEPIWSRNLGVRSEPPRLAKYTNGFLAVATTNQSNSEGLFALINPTNGDNAFVYRYPNKNRVAGIAIDVLRQTNDTVTSVWSSTENALYLTHHLSPYGSVEWTRKITAPGLNALSGALTVRFPFIFVAIVTDGDVAGLLSLRNDGSDVGAFEVDNIIVTIEAVSDISTEADGWETFTNTTASTGIVNEVGDFTISDDDWEIAVPVVEIYAMPPAV